LEELGINAMSGNEFIMGAVLYETSIIKHDNGVEMAYG